VEAIVDHYITLQSGVPPEKMGQVVMNYNTLGSPDRNLAAHSTWHANQRTAYFFLFGRRFRNMLAVKGLRRHT
jgi:hypothetical protein